MKLQTLVILCVAALGVTSCSNDHDLLNYNQNSFLYINTVTFDDYNSDSKLLLNNGNETIPIHISNGRIDYQIVNSEIFYKDGYEIIKFNPSTNQTQIVASLTDIQIHSFDVSPNNEYMAFSDHEDIFLLNFETGSTENITANLEGHFRFPEWSPNGNSILMENGISIVRPGDSYPTATGNFKIFSLTQESFQDVEMLDLFASPGYAAWSPDGEMIIYEQYQAVFTFNINTEQLRRITSEEIVATNPGFSTNGDLISYFSSDLSDNGNNWQNFLTIYNTENGTTTIINDSYSYDASWKPDSSEILFCTRKGIFSYNLSNGVITTKVNSEESTYLSSVSFLN